MIKIAPSILSADFTRLGEEINSVRSADRLHFDVMDGMFVNNISIGLPVLESVREANAAFRHADMTLEAHLMIASPARYTARFAEAGADIVIFHVEAETAENTLRALEELRGLDKKTGLSIKPDTPAEALSPYIGVIDIALVMTVEPGFGGQSFIAAMLPKISALRGVIDGQGLLCEIGVDGGINPETAKLCVGAGADVLVAGSCVFGSPDRAARIKELRAARA